jgi:hypothetical protein
MSLKQMIKFVSPEVSQNSAQYDLMIRKNKQNKQTLKQTLSATVKYKRVTALIQD